MGTVPLPARAEWALAGRQALVTGGGSGIGLACARALAGAGARVTVLGRREARLRAAVAKGAAAALVAADVAGQLPQLQPCDLLVNAAGAAESAPFLRTDAAMWRRMLDANLLGAAAVTRAVLPGMLEAGFGRVVNVASTAAIKGYPYVTAYVAAKHGLLGLTRALALEVAGHGVTVNAVCPGFADTPLLEASVSTLTARTGRDEAAVRASLVRHNPQGRLIQPEEVAAAVLFLCLPEAAAVNGVALPISGGEA